MNKADLVEVLKQETQIDGTQVEKVLDSFFEVIGKTLKKGERINIFGWGTFSLSRRKARQGRNPKTGEIVDYPETVTAKFKAGKFLKKAVAN